jgi:hypothetical protein
MDTGLHATQLAQGPSPANVLLPSYGPLRTAPPQVFSTYSNEDYDRRNEDVDPMAASAEYELEKRVERLELFPVELEKGERPGQSKAHTGVSRDASLGPATPVGTRMLGFLTLSAFLGIPCPHQ